MTTISIQVDEPTAQAFESASQTTRDQITVFVQGYISSALLSKQERLRRFREVADECGRQAQANGWNDELDAALLRGDFDDE